MFNSILVFSAHPDDEVIGCGGTLRKLSDEGSTVRVVVATGGETGISPKFDSVDDIVEMRKEESNRTKEILGIEEIIYLPNKTQELANTKSVFHDFIRFIRRYKPDLVLTHASQDKHRDHIAVCEITCEAVWKANENLMHHLGERHRVSELWHYEVLDPFATPDVYMDISDSLDRKREAMREHVSQQEILAGIDRFIEGLAKVRGFAIERPYAEAFVTSNMTPRLVSSLVSNSR